ncbi:MAG: nicotinate-nicotinamide nucleotide adenylyltransferase [Deltaproteobacteria bacterium]|nr:MAG: nicotinate-nicotinamide nucleotide adenylyltransferase [Deltaproteobacteria bacterium]
MTLSGEVALFGGSFNPPHIGHVWAAASVLAVESVDHLLFVPTHTHAFGKPLAPFAARVAMCRAVAELFDERVRVSTIEGDLARKGQENRTVDTLRALSHAYPQARFALVVGSDLLAELDDWKEIDTVRAMARFIVLPREGFPGGKGPPIPNVSSTWIRAQLARGASVEGFVPRAVEALCRAEGWYAHPPG